MRLSVLAVALGLVACGSDSSTTNPIAQRDAGPSDGAPPSDGSPDAGDGGAQAARPGCPAAIGSDPTIAQALPTAFVATEMPQLTGKTTNVNAGADLQAAIDAAQPGDTLALEAGATFEGPITLPNKAGGGWIVIRTRTPDAELAPPGTRVTPSLAPKMAKITASSGRVVGVAKGAHHFRLIGLELTATAGSYINSAVDLSVSTSDEAELAHDIVVDRVYLHGDPVGARRGVALNSKAAAVVDSYIAGFREHGADSQAIAGWSGPGPYRIVNNYLEGASENVMFGGSDPSIANLVPSDIEICSNYLKKDLAWKGGGWVVKNLFELKNARRVVVAGNVMEYNWADAQVGFGVLFTPRNQDGAAPWSGVEDVTFAYNVVRHTASGVNLLSTDDLHTSLPLRRIVVHDNLFDDVGPAGYGGDGRAWQFINGGGRGGGIDIKIDHNTTTHANNAALTIGDDAGYGTNFVFTNNVVAHGQYGVFGSGQGQGKNALDFFLASYTFKKNAIFGGGSAGAYPADNWFPAAIGDVGFVNPGAGDFSLAPASPYRGAGSDGRDVGADMAAVASAVKNVAP